MMNNTKNKNNKNNKTYIFHTDPGHAWLAVKRSELHRLGLLDKISGCSYQNGQTVYLEEDCDFNIFRDEKEKHGETVNYRESYQETSAVRSYPQFRLRDYEKRAKKEGE